ncbi:MAG TPA: endonuclease domain-containing protein [Candidatus Kapabacteria bacterium]|nr:endonuclease domain-containing protein [Candidatus Kapabacteria bacterium]
MHEQFFNKGELKARRRSLRNDLTRAEQEMWHGLRKRRAEGYKFRRQHSIGPFIADFYCPKHRIVVEVDGDTHNLPGQLEYDANRTAFMQRNGIEVIRFTNEEVLYSVDLCVNKIMALIENLKQVREEPPPNPLLQKEGES